MHIVQRYLERPLCFCGYKLDLRIYVLLVSAQPLRIYWFNDCLVRFATQKYVYHAVHMIYNGDFEPWDEEETPGNKLVFTHSWYVPRS